jgi:hypothetical protein
MYPPGSTPFSSNTMRIFLSLVGIVFSFVIIKYRERVGDMLGEPAWAAKVGGIYNVLIIVGLLFFFWSLASLTNTTEILFAPIFAIFPNSHSVPPPTY